MNHCDRLRHYQVRVEGHVRMDWFEDASVEPIATGDTMIKGTFDQAALHGVLGRIRDLGLVLLTVQSRPTGESANAEER